MDSKDLDEMQISRRNHIGNQSFLLMFYLLLLDVGLHGFGVKWLEYPLNIFVIIMGCTVQYLVRTILAGAYVSQEKKDKNSKTKKPIGAVVATGIACFAGLAYTGSFREEGTNGGLLLFVLATGTLVVCIILMKWSERRNNQGEE